MRKIITVFLVIGNILTFQFYNATQHHRDNFALCGSSINEASDKNLEEDEMVSVIKLNQSKNLLKEVKSEFNDHLMNLSMDVELKCYYIDSCLLSMEEIKVDDLFLSSIFKPPKA
ncbi:MAG: hypothetical protein OEV78_12730 [Spirochaetia bacterium]|nr:hypothetical protein [Spirochaetia bacterium]